jgi:divalent metal cation (Fe/Co/Zn/Cd) transporter
MLILIAAVSIGVTAVDRLITPKPLEEIGIGLAVSIVASLVNLGVALLLLRAPGARATRHLAYAA